MKSAVWTFILSPVLQLAQGPRVRQGLSRDLDAFWAGVLAAMCGALPSPASLNQHTACSMPVDTKYGSRWQYKLHMKQKQVFL